MTTANPATASSKRPVPSSPRATPMHANAPVVARTYEEGLPLHPDHKYEPCPGFRGRACGVMVPAPRILCYFCAKSARLAREGG
jgi:hypothetical protein